MPQTTRKDALIVFLLLAFVFVYFYQDGGPNGNSRFSLIFASVQERRLSIDNYIYKTDTFTKDRSFFNGHYYSDKAVGPAVIGAALYAPVYLINRVFHLSNPSPRDLKVIFTFLIIGFPSAIAGSLMYILCLYLSGNRFRSFLTTLAISLGTMCFPFSVLFFSHQLTSSLLFSAFFMIFFLKESPRSRGYGYLFLIGLLLGWALISEYPAAVIILALVAYYISVIWKKHPYRHWHAFLMPFLGGVIPILIQLLNNKVSFDNFFSIGYSNLQNQFFMSSMSQGLAGISWPNLNVLYYTTFHPGMGLFWESPVLLLSFIGAGTMFFQRRYRGEAILAACIISFYPVILSGYFAWWGGWSFGPRHLIPMLPFFGLFLIFVPKQLKWPFLALTLVSIGQMLIVTAGMALTPEMWVTNIMSMGFFEFSNIYNVCLKQLLDGKFAQNLGQQFLHLNSWSSLIPLAVIFLGITLFFFWYGRNAPSEAAKGE